MKVYIRNGLDTKGKYFCDCSPFDMETLMSEIQQAGGICVAGELIEDVEYQFIDSNGQTGAEIIYIPK